MRAGTLLPAVMAAAVLAGCAAPRTKRVTVNDARVQVEARKQREIALQTELAAQGRLDRVSWPLLQAAAPFCKDHTHAGLGLTYANKYGFAKAFRDTAVSMLDMGEPLQALEVVPAGPAARAGLRKGDVLAAVNGKPVPTGEKAAGAMRELLDKQLAPDKPARLSVVRGGKDLTVTVVPAQACKFPVVLQDSDAVNAFADGSKVVVTTGLLRFARSDNELALVISHEIAHDAMKHIAAKRENYMLGSLLDIVAAAYGVNTQGAFGNAAARAHSQGFEAEADYVGLYIMARSGRDIDNSPRFWRRMAASHPGSIQRSGAASHPATPERFLAMEKTIKEIKKKERLGEPLVPEYKDKASPGDKNQPDNQSDLID